MAILVKICAYGAMYMKRSMKLYSFSGNSMFYPFSVDSEDVPVYLQIEIIETTVQKHLNRRDRIQR